ncbi:MAG TPA: ABC transporter substrate-binding protein [Nocardioidaceae bacterium]|nr:ABC transporter substrate-binding protein [Nocardioidaceae bacterium]
MHTSHLPRRTRTAVGLAALALTSLGLTACSDSEASSDEGGGGGGTEVALGYFPNLTHATALVGMEQGLFEDQLSEDGSSVKYSEFNSGSDTIEALLSGSLDATYIGPSPALTAYSQSEGAVRIVAGAASGGAALVTSSDIASVQDLEGKTIATPGAGNTQDIAARYFLEGEGLQADDSGDGDVTIIPQDNSVTLQAFQQGEIDGAWVPEPYLSLMVDAGGKVLVDEAELWPEGEFVTTQLLVSTEFLESEPDAVAALLSAHVEANAYLNDNQDEAQTLVQDKLTELTKAEIPDDVFSDAWDNITFTNDPVASSFVEGGEHARQVLTDVEIASDLEGIYDLDPLNEVLSEQGEEEVSGP